MCPCVRCGPRCLRSSPPFWPAPASQIRHSPTRRSIDASIARFGVPAAECDDRNRRHGSLGVRPGGHDAHRHLVRFELDEAQRDPRTERSADRAHLQRRRHVQLPLQDPQRDDRLGRVQAPALERVLVFSKTGGFRHDSIPQGIAAIQALGTANGFTVVATEDPTQFTDANLATFDVVVFLSTTGEVLDTPSRRPSSATSRVAAATPASTPPRTPSTRGRGTASWSAAISATTRPERPTRT